MCKNVVFCVFHTGYERKDSIYHLVTVNRRIIVYLLLSKCAQNCKLGHFYFTHPNMNMTVVDRTAIVVDQAA